MKASRVIRFAVAALLVSIGCIALLANVYGEFTVLCLNLPAFVLMKRSEITRPVRNREVWIILAVLVVALTAIILANIFIPISDAAAMHVARNPAFVVPFWALFMVGLYWRWRREKRADAASQIATANAG